RRAPAAIAAARRELAPEILFYQYLQWVAATQWSAARRRTNGVQLFGDLPFMVDGDSADVWARQHQFLLDVSLGAPPDAFSADGQDRSEEHTSELQSRFDLVCRLLLEKKKPLAACPPTSIPPCAISSKCSSSRWSGSVRSP